MYLYEEVFPEWEGKLRRNIGKGTSDLRIEGFCQSYRLENTEQLGFKLWPNYSSAGANAIVPNNVKTQVQKEIAELEVLWFAGKDIYPIQCRLQKLVKESKFFVRNWNLFIQAVLIIRLNH